VEDIERTVKTGQCRFQKMSDLKEVGERKKNLTTNAKIEGSKKRQRKDN